MPRQIRIEGSTAFVVLTKGYEAAIDVADVHLVSGNDWQASIEPNGLVYAICTIERGGKKKTLRMHRVVSGAERGDEIDHRDVDGLNNRRANLRKSSRSQNKANSQLSCRNTSGFKGVCKVGDKWRSGIRKNGKHISLGYFDAPELAHQAYIEAAQTLFGEFARSS